jgi:hypothetical protein
MTAWFESISNVVDFAGAAAVCTFDAVREYFNVH